MKKKILLPLSLTPLIITPSLALISCSNSYGVTFVKDIKVNIEVEYSVVWWLHLDVEYSKNITTMSPTTFEFKKGLSKAQLTERLSYPSKSWEQNISASFFDGTHTTFTIKVEYSVQSSSAKILSIRVQEKI